MDYKTPSELERERATREFIDARYSNDPAPAPETPLPPTPPVYACEADRIRAEAKAANEKQFDAAREAGKLPIEEYFAQRNEIHRQMGYRRRPR